VENEDVTRVANAIMATGWETIPKHQVIVIIIDITDFENSRKLRQVSGILRCPFPCCYHNHLFVAGVFFFGWC